MKSSCGDLLFSSTAPLFRTELLLDRDVSSRAFSFYYPKTRPGIDRCSLVSCANAHYEDWAGITDEEYEHRKQELIDTTMDRLECHIPGIREKVDHLEASTPRTFEHYTQHVRGASFRHQVRRPGRQPRSAAANRRPVPRRQRRHYHVRLAGLGELRRDRRQRSRRPVDEIRRLL